MLGEDFELESRKQKYYLKLNNHVQLEEMEKNRNELNKLPIIEFNTFKRQLKNIFQPKR